MVDWTQVLVASAVPTGAVLVAIIGLIPVLKKNQRSTEQAAHQAQEATKAANAATYAVTNGHPLPLRDDLDRKFNRVFSAIAKVDGKVDYQRHQIEAIQEEIGVIRSREQELKDRVDDIEDTIPASKLRDQQ